MLARIFMVMELPLMSLYVNLTCIGYHTVVPSGVKEKMARVMREEAIMIKDFVKSPLAPFNFFGNRKDK